MCEQYFRKVHHHHHHCFNGWHDLVNFWRKEQCVGVVEFCSILDHFFCFTLQSCFCPSPSVCVFEENSAETSSRFTTRCGVCLCVWFSALLKYWITFCRRRLDGTTTSSSRSSSSIAAAHSSACWSSAAAAYCFSSLAFDFVTFEGGKASVSWEIAPSTWAAAAAATSEQFGSNFVL